MKCRSRWYSSHGAGTSHGAGGAGAAAGPPHPAARTTMAAFTAEHDRRAHHEDPRGAPAPPACWGANAFSVARAPAPGGGGGGGGLDGGGAAMMAAEWLDTSRGDAL